MKLEDFEKYGINPMEFAELWLRKYYPRRKETKVVDGYYEYDSFCVGYNRKIDGYASNHFEYSYIVDFMRAAGKINELKKAE